MNQPEKTSGNVIWDIDPNREVILIEPVDKVSSGWFYLTVKRAFDILASLLMLLVLMIPMLILALIIVLDSPGGAVYRQVRLGKDGKPFSILKFRSMRADAEASGIQWAKSDDPRVTRIGRFMRNTRLDELPQLINILKGEMSFVGPRPERPEFYDIFDTYIIGFRQRMLVKPGLTGHAQVNGGYSLLPEEKIRYDIEYIRTRSIRLDLICLFKTVGVMIGKKGAR